MRTKWDIAVIGAGPAGLSAAIAAARDGASCLCIDRLGPGGMLINLGALHDMPDLPAGTTGPDLMANLLDEAMAAGVEMAVGEVLRLASGDGWTIETDDGAHRARAIIIATGLSQGTLGVEGETAFEGQGLSHCATCDGPLYAGEDVIVAGADDWAVQEAIDLAVIARQVTLVPGGEALAASPARAAALASLTNVRTTGGRIVALEGVGGLEAVTVESDGGRQRVAARAVFAYAGRTPMVSPARALLDLDAAGHIMVEEDLRAGAPGLFAVGDVRAGAPQRLAAAMADGRHAGRVAAQAVKAQAGAAQDAG